MKLTGWYEGTQKPIRNGLYQRRYANRDILYCKWDGIKWGLGKIFPEHASTVTAASTKQNLPWRGITK